jgi:hydroxyacylglutathione hydrolase
MNIPLEDLFEDIVGKAQRGLQVSDQDLARRAQLTVEQLRALKQEAGAPDEVPAVAEALGLGPKSLTASYLRSWFPEDVPDIEGVKQFNSSLMEMTVNAYVIWNPETKDAAVFDTGSDAGELLEFIDSAGLTAKYLFLTHTHQDHVADLGAIAKRTHTQRLQQSR